MAEEPEVLNKIVHFRTPASRRKFARQVVKEAVAREEENKADQARYKSQTNSPFMSVGPKVRERANAVRAVEHLRKVRDSLRGKVVVGGDDEANKAYDHASRQLAENLATLGEFEQAKIIHPDEKNWKEYEAIEKAIDCDDDVWCECPLYTIARQPGVGQMAIPNFHRVIDVFSKKHGVDVPVMKCKDCGFMNVRHSTVEERDLKHTRTKALKLIEGKDQSEHRAILEAAGLTAARVFKADA